MLENKILDLVTLHYQATSKKSCGVIPYAGRVYDEKEIRAAVSACLNFWLTLGDQGELFEKEFAQYLGLKHCVMTNSGSSANLLAVSALTSHKLGNRKLTPGDEIITCAAGFPTTVAPIIQNGFIPVFIDNDPHTGNALVSQLESAWSTKTKAVIFAHTLGNPVDVHPVIEFCQKYGLWFIEDNCDALGSTYRSGYTGKFGHMSTQSFYPPHHMTMGEGGCVNTNDEKLKSILKSFRDWGRDCWCESGVDNTCNKRFGWKAGELTQGYDHKYIYSHLGYNLKPTDIQAAIGREQLKKLPIFCQKRKDNWKYLREKLSGIGDLEFSTPEPYCDPSWFAFMMLTKRRNELAKYLDINLIGNRMLFGGNLTKQPAFVQLKKDRPNAFRVIGDLAGADRLMNEALFVGVYPGLTKEMLDYIIHIIKEFNW